MRITFVHNQTAGYDDHHGEELLALMRTEGHEPTYLASDDEKLEKGLEDPGELVVIAGGDGTIDAVAPLLAGRDIPLALLPLGTANNIATGLGIVGEPTELIASWKTAQRMKFDLGVAKGPWGKMPFMEAAGFGLFAQMMPLVNALGKPQEHESGEEHVRHEIEMLKALLDACRASSGEIELDGKSITGDFLMVEVMNISTVGPGLQLAPDADSGDGLLDLVIIEEEDRTKLADYLAQCLKTARPPADFKILRAKEVKFTWEGATIHVDSSLWGTSEDRPKKVKKPKKSVPAAVEFRLKPQALEILVPNK